MFEPTDRALKLQGLSRADYDMMDRDGKKLIADRSQHVIDIANTTLVLKLMNAMIEADPQMKDRLLQVMEGGEENLQKYISKTVYQYLQTDMKAGIRQYYFEILKRARENKPQPERPAPIEHKRKEAESPVQSRSISGEERRVNIATSLSKIQKRPLESVLRSESDLIDQIIEATNENVHIGVTDDRLLDAAARLIEEDNQVEFIMEALMPENRQSLIQLARKYQKDL